MTKGLNIDGKYIDSHLSIFNVLQYESGGLIMKKCKEKVLAYGEVTGHKHAVTVDVYEDDKCKYFRGSTTVTHEEHKPIEIPEGKWCSGQVMEYDHFAEEARQVHD